MATVLSQASAQQMISPGAATLNVFPGRRIRLCNSVFLSAIPFSLAARLPNVDYVECSPAECARRLDEGEADLAYLPFTEYILHGGYEALEYGVAAKEGIGSLVLLAAQPLEELETIFVDPSSHNPALLLQILLPEMLGEKAAKLKLCCTQNTRAVQQIGDTIGAFVIGDEALWQHGRYAYEYDLAQLWLSRFSMPLLFGLWSYRSGRVAEAELAAIRSIFTAGIEHCEVLARTWADAKGFNREEAARYLTEYIVHQLDERVLEGARLFIVQGQRAKLFPTASTISVSERATGMSVIQMLRPSTDQLLLSASEGERLSLENMRQLLKHATPAELITAADLRRQALHPKSEVLLPLELVLDVNKVSSFASLSSIRKRFSAPQRSEQLQTEEDIRRLISHLSRVEDLSVTLQGVICSGMTMENLEDILHWLRGNKVRRIFVLTPDEFQELRRTAQLSANEALKRLVQAGLTGFELSHPCFLVDRVRTRFPQAILSADQWLETVRLLADAGGELRLGMSIGVYERWDDRLSHLAKVRALADEGIKATIFLLEVFQTQEELGGRQRFAALEYLRCVAISRLFLDSFKHIGSSGSNMPQELAALSLHAGASAIFPLSYELNLAERQLLSIRREVFGLRTTWESTLNDLGFQLAKP